LGNKKEVVYTVYFLKFKSKKGAKQREMFYKIGITKQPLSRRISSFKKVYDIEVMETIKLSEEQARRLEKSFLNEYWNHRYYPKISFVGKSEALKNKMMFKMGDVLNTYWDKINNIKDKEQYYADRAEAKDRFWANKHK